MLLVDADPQGDLTKSLGWRDPDSLETTLATHLSAAIAGSDDDPGGYAPPPRGRRPHALQHRARRHGDGGVHGDVPRADDGRLARAHQGGLRLRHRRLRAHPGNNPHQRTGRRGQRPHPGFRRVPPGIRHDRPPEDRGAGQEADKPGLSVEGILVTLYDSRNNLARDVERTVRGQYGKAYRVFETVVSRRFRRGGVLR